MPMMMKHFYFDHNATTPVRPEVVQEMLPYLNIMYGNASSAHWFGRDAKNALEKSRETCAAQIGAEPDEVYFTGCGTESDNIALAGLLRAADPSRNGLVTTAIEHSAILKTAARLGTEGFPVAIAGVDDQSRVNMDELADKTGTTTALISVMHANNETGVVQNIEKAAEIAHAAGALFHTDAVQSAGKKGIDVRKMGIDMLSMSGHKLNAPKGVGLLYVRRGVKLQPLTTGGSHERGLRPGTENVAGVVAFAKAFEIAVAEMDTKNRALAAMRDRLEQGIESSIPGVLFNGRQAERLPGTCNISIPGVDGEALLFGLDREGIAASTGSACSTGEVEPSHVLLALGREPKVAQSSLRFSMGWGTNDEGIDHVLAVLPGIVERLRSISGGI